MKTIIIALTILFAIAEMATAQGTRTFYNVCMSNTTTYIDFYRDEIRVKNLSPDLIIFESDGVNYSGTKVDGFDIFQGGKSETTFYAYKVDDNSFFIMSFGGFTYYHADRRVGNAGDNNVRCAVNHLNRFETLVNAFKEKEKEIGKQKENDFNSQTKGVVTDWVRGLRSARTDAALERDIHVWWKSGRDAAAVDPLLKIYFLQPSYEIVRNDVGVVLRKTVDAVLVSRTKSNSKCFMQWRSFGYESLGGGAFDPEPKAWLKQYQAGFGSYTYALTLTGDRKIHAGTMYEVDCASFAK